MTGYMVRTISAPKILQRYTNSRQTQSFLGFRRKEIYFTSKAVLLYAVSVFL